MPAVPQWFAADCVRAICRCLSAYGCAARRARYSRQPAAVGKPPPCWRRLPAASGPDSRSGSSLPKGHQRAHRQAGPRRLGRSRTRTDLPRCWPASDDGIATPAPGQPRPPHPARPAASVTLAGRPDAEVQTSSQTHQGGLLATFADRPACSAGSEHSGLPPSRRRPVGCVRKDPPHVPLKIPDLQTRPGSRQTRSSAPAAGRQPPHGPVRSAVARCRSGAADRP
jgi:hypothetical protein